MWIDAVLPLALRDASRAEFLFESLKLNFSGLRRIWVICPESQLHEIKQKFSVLSLPFELCIESELRVVPEFNIKVRQSGWFKQQLIKLAIHEFIESDLYLTLDADVVCARPVTAAQLIEDGRGRCFLVYPNHYGYWYQRVNDVLRLKSAGHRGLHNVTPALLHRKAVKELKEKIEQMLCARLYSKGWRGVKQRWHLWVNRNSVTYAPWRIFLVAARPWTEYALYYTFLEANGRFDEYHYYSDVCLYDVERSLWAASNGELPDQWIPAPAFIGEGPPWFLVAQSNTGISAEVIRERLEPLLKKSL